MIGDRIDRALVAGARVPNVRVPETWQQIEAAHPFPDDASVAAGRAALTLARQAGERRLLVLLSGGASSMLCAPAAGVERTDKVATTRALMKAGVPIHDLNCVRKHLSDVKGGRLGSAAASGSLTLAISDVHHPVRDDPSVIGSGPTVPDSTTFGQAFEIAQSVDGIPPSVLQRLRDGAAGRFEETIKPGDVRLSNARFHLVANRETVLRAATEAAGTLGYTVTTRPEPTHGEARTAATDFARYALQQRRREERPICVLAAGETTVRVSGRGLGGRNQEFALAMVPELAPDRQRSTDPEDLSVVACSVGTDGIDGPTPAAGAIVDSTTLSRARHTGLDYEHALADNDAYTFFHAIDDLIVLGPTGTNVGDLQVLLIA